MYNLTAVERLTGKRTVIGGFKSPVEASEYHSVYFGIDFDLEINLSDSGESNNEMEVA